MRTALALFLFGLLLRLLFWHAGPDGGLGWHVGFQGDAPVWQDLCLRLATDRPDAELRLPWRAPGMLWLTSLLWDGGGATWAVRFVYALAGATIAPLVWQLLRRAVAPAVAVTAAVLAGASSNLLLLSSGVQVEGLYLALALLALWLQNGLAAGPRIGGAIALAVGLGALHGGLCLLRTEHLLTFAALALVALWCRMRWWHGAVVVAAAAVTITPWQFEAARRVDVFNHTGAPGRLTLPWDDDARDTVLALPAFAHRHVLELVDQTVALRGGERVRAADLAIVREAYDAWPEPLPVPLIALYGPFNFFLANSPESNGGYSRAALDRDPPLLGGEAIYPQWVRRTLRRGKRFSLGYPPHLDRTLHGYARGIDELTSDPAGAISRLGIKLWHVAEGATGGVGGYALPIGMSGERRAVDLVTATGWWAAVWRLLVLGVAVYGLWRVRGERALWPLWAFAVTKIVTVALFFGYARQGALLVPAVAVGAAVVIGPWLGRQTDRRRWLPWCLPALLLAVEAVRAGTVTATLDGQPVVDREPFPVGEFTRRTIEFR
ncbi:MAG: hypothetical protein NXI31_04040 [bacterium]|nr:hypothetical protein [bacterium]